MRPRGSPPIPSARSSESDPVETAPIATWAWSFMRITEPLPNWRSIWPSAVSRACSRSTLISLPLPRIRGLRIAPHRGVAVTGKQPRRTARTAPVPAGPGANAGARGSARRSCAAATSVVRARRRRAPRAVAGDRPLAQRAEDAVQLRAHAVTEEGERDVHARARDRPDARDVEGLALPAHELVERRFREPQGAEEADALIGFEATSSGHAESSRLRAKSTRRRCSAVTVDRPRIAARSPGRSRRRANDPSGPSACKNTRPTGLSGVPPPGPATPVTETATSAPSRALAPAAIAAAASAED